MIEGVCLCLGVYLLKVQEILKMATHHQRPPVSRGHHKWRHGQVEGLVVALHQTPEHQRWLNRALKRCLKSAVALMCLLPMCCDSTQVDAAQVDMTVHADLAVAKMLVSRLEAPCPSQKLVPGLRLVSLASG